MTQDKCSLVAPSARFEEAFREMAAEFRHAGQDRHEDLPKDFGEYVRRLRAQSRGIGLKPGHVAQSTYWLVSPDGRVLGTSRLRHRLTPQLEHSGGHIGYDVRPSERRKGYGTRLLALTLQRARELGMERVLLTCDDDNLASARIIEKNEGQLENKVLSPRSGKLHRRYWVEVATAEEDD
ncbi:MAG: GNAT family N-acetyltransferase [Candidatus Brocadiia bacterium]